MTAQASFLLGNWLGGLVPAALMALLLVFVLRSPLSPLKCAIAFVITVLVTVALTNLGNGQGRFADRLANFGDPVGLLFALPPALLVWAILLSWGWSKDRALHERNE